MKRKFYCHDCGAPEGGIHDGGCDMEICPFCHGQLLCCDCVFEKLGIPQDTELTKEQCQTFSKMLEEAGRIPYMHWRWVCAYCGIKDPEMFMVPNEEWKKYIDEEHRGEVVCRKCYDHIKERIDYYKGE